MVSYGLLKACAEAAECSKPKLTLEPVCHDKISHVNLIRSICGTNNVFVVAATQSYLYVLEWTGGYLKLKKRVDTKEPVTCIHMTPNAVIFGSDKIYELDLKTFVREGK